MRLPPTRLCCQLLTSTSGLASTSTRSSHSATGTWNRLRDFIFATEKENFHSDFVIRSHRWDGVNRDEWKLIYRDIGASRSFFMVSSLLPLSLIGAFVIFWDISSNPEKERFEFVRRLQKDARELGGLVYVPCTALVLVVCLLLRVQNTRLLRIYQNRKNVDDYIAIASRMVVGQKQVKFDRNVASAFYFGDDYSDTMQLVLHFLVGNIQIDRSKYMVMDDCFRANNFRSYMLNETSVPPRLGTTVSKDDPRL